MKPMLAAKADLAKLQYPVYASPKLDGIRALIVDGVVLSRTFKPIPNAGVQAKFGRLEYNGYDGELILGSPTSPTAFRDTTSVVMSDNKDATDVAFFVFDDFLAGGGWYQRFDSIPALPGNDVIKVRHVHVGTPSLLDSVDAENMAEGYEGTMLRSTNGPYKHGRSTVNEGYLLKVKQFEDAEAEVIGFEELMHNGNVAEKDAFGRTKRSSHQANKSGLNRLGALILRRPDGVEFNCGTGFDDAERVIIWNRRPLLLGKFAKYRYFPSGGKDKPRFPVFLGLRDARDMGG